MAVAQSSPRSRDTHTYYRAFRSGAVTTCFYDLGLSRLGFEHPTFRLQGQRSNRLRYCRGEITMKQDEIRIILDEIFRIVIINIY